MRSLIASLLRYRVLMIVATRDRMIRNRVVTLDRAMTRDDLIELRNYVNANFAGVYGYLRANPM